VAGECSTGDQCAMDKMKMDKMTTTPSDTWANGRRRTLSHCTPHTLHTLQKALHPTMKSTRDTGQVIKDWCSGSVSKGMRLKGMRALSLRLLCALFVRRRQVHACAKLERMR
jgi:hypothetical protein